jgi:hypothetical protein
MWVLRYLICVVSSHAYADILLEKSAYRYCLRCGRVEPLSGADDPEVGTCFKEVGK